MVQFKDDTFDASKHPAPQLWCHITQKGIQGGAVIGSFAVAPALAAYQAYIKKEKVDPLKLAEGVAYSTLAAVGLTGGHVGAIWEQQQVCAGRKFFG